jgi:hypothetical protein
VTDALASVAGLVVAPTVAAGLIRWSPETLIVENWRGVHIPAVLGLGFIAGCMASVPFMWGSNDRSSDMGVLALISAGAMGLAGLLDDLRGGAARGFRGHLQNLIRLRLTTGGVKLLVGVAIAVFLAVRAGGSPERMVGAALLIAISTNLANTLDVRPGRALKFTLPILIVVWVASSDPGVKWVSAAAVGAGVGIMPLDLAERGMLGDAGANPIGLLAGLGLVLILPTWGVLLGAGIAAVLQVAAETITISRLLEAVPPVRWFDRLGRRN